MFHGKIHYRWPFLIAMLNYKRVTKNLVFHPPKLISIPMKNGKTDQTLVDFSESMWNWPSKNCDQSQIKAMALFSPDLSRESRGVSWRQGAIASAVGPGKYNRRTTGILYMQW